MSVFGNLPCLPLSLVGLPFARKHFMLPTISLLPFPYRP